MRYLGIDYGTKRTGLAVCDAGEQMACPLKVLQNKGSFLADIIAAVRREGIEAIVFGLPLNMDGTEGPMVKSTRQFAEQLQKQTELPIEFFDERLTSFAAEKKLAGLDLTRKTKKKRIDALAAAEMLQNFLDHKNNRTE